MKKTICLILLAAMLVSSSACGGAETADETTAGDSTSASEETSGEETPDTPSRDSVPSSIPADLKFDGETVTVLTREEERYLNEFRADEENGDTMNDAIFARNSKTEEQLGIDMKIMTKPGAWLQHTAFNNAVKRDVMAGSTEYDVISYYAYAMPMIAIENVLYNLNDVENLDLTKPWWHQKFIGNAEVYGKLFSVAGDINLTSVSYRGCLYFNKRLMESYYPDVDIYKTVLDGKFTEDYFTSLVKDTYIDLNSDGKKDVDDFYGYYSHNALDSFPVGAGITYTKKTEDGGYEYDLFNERNNTILERFYSMWNDNNGVFLDDGTDLSFEQGNCVFFTNELYFTERLRSMEDAYGILPLPKYDEAQEQYYSIANDNFSLMAVPSTAKNPALSGAFMELMGEYSYKMVTPKYYEVAMKGKYLRDDESCQMFDIIVDGAWYDFANINTSVLGDPVFITRNACCHAGGKNFASLWAGSEQKLEKQLEKLLETYRNS